MIPSEAVAKARSLSAVQRTYLGHVAQGLTSKQIAQLLGGSHHTVNVEIGIAMRVLGAKSRHEAAITLNEINRLASYEPSYEPNAIVSEPAPLNRSDQNEGIGGLRETTALALPIPTQGRRTNTLTPLQRVGWILVIASSTALLLAGLVSGISSLLVNLHRLS